MDRVERVKPRRIPPPHPRVPDLVELVAKDEETALACQGQPDAECELGVIGEGKGEIKTVEGWALVGCPACGLATLLRVMPGKDGARVALLRTLDPLAAVAPLDVGDRCPDSWHQVEAKSPPGVGRKRCPACHDDGDRTRSLFEDAPEAQQDGQALLFQT